MLNCGILFKENYESPEEIIINQGGSSSGL